MSMNVYSHPFILHTGGMSQVDKGTDLTASFLVWIHHDLKFNNTKAHSPFLSSCTGSMHSVHWQRERQAGWVSAQQFPSGLSVTHKFQSIIVSFRSANAPVFITRFSVGHPSGVCNFALSGFLPSSNKQDCVHSKKKKPLLCLSKELVDSHISFRACC